MNEVSGLCELEKVGATIDKERERVSESERVSEKERDKNDEYSVF